MLVSNPNAKQETWYYEIKLPEELQRFSKGSPIADQHFAETREMWRKWRSYLVGKIGRPFEYASDIRDRWQAHFAWEDYRTDKKKCQHPKQPDHPGDGNSVFWDVYYITSKRCERISPPYLPPEPSSIYKEAHLSEGPQPTPPYTSWVELSEEMEMKHVIDLTPKE